MKGGWWIPLVLLFHLVSIECTQNQSKVDECSSCLDGTSLCPVVTGIFTRLQLDVGYNFVTHIPRGACSLNVTEIRRSPNHLALRAHNSTFIFNGNWRLSPSGAYSGAGALIHYRRQDLTSLESIFSPGPLHEPVDLLVLHQQQNPGIKYEYKLPPSISKSGKGGPLLPARLNKPQVNTDHLQTSLQSRSNGNGGLQQDSFSSASGKINNKNKIHRHLHLAKPVSISKPHKNIYYWKIIGYTNCSEPCGGGIQRSIIHCARSTEQTGTVLVPERYCLTEEKPLEQRVRCNVKPCPAEWVMEDWSECKGECGEGLMTRQVHCQQRVTPTLKMRVSEGACLEMKPEEKRKCELNKKCNLWEASDWGPCSESCGNGVRRREIKCNDESGECDDSMKPIEVKPCNMGPCLSFAEEDGIWMMSDWGTRCSSKCGKGVETRHVTCSGATGNAGGYYGYTYEFEKNRNENELKAVLIHDKNAVGPEVRISEFDDEQRCNYEKKPVEERECFSEKDCGDPQWFTGDWGECSSTCGSGFKTRQVLCVQFVNGKYKIFHDSACIIESKPPTKASCKTPTECPPKWFATEWSECSALCGGGVQRRIVICRTVNGSEARDSCDDKDKPMAKKTCNEVACKTLNNRTSVAMSSDEYQHNSNHANLLQASSADLLSELTHDAEPLCVDEYRNCALVIQARLCRYKYYLAVCCHSCS